MMGKLTASPDADDRLGRDVRHTDMTCNVALSALRMRPRHSFPAHCASGDGASDTLPAPVSIEQKEKLLLL
jgi:hypothetical protein